MKRLLACLFVLTLVFSVFAAVPAMASPEKNSSPSGNAFLRHSIVTSKDVEYDDVYLWLDKSVVNLKKGKSTTIKATVEPSDTKIKWKSTNAKVAKVSSKGKVTAVAQGTAWIVAEAQISGTYKPSSSCFVTVTGGKGVKIVGSSDLNCKLSNKKITVGKDTYKTVSGKITGGKKYYDEDSYEDYGQYAYYLGSKNYDNAHTYVWFMTNKLGKMKADSLRGVYATSKKSSLTTNRGIKIGSTKKQVEAKYGLYTEKETVKWDGKNHDVFYYTGLVKAQLITVRVAYLKGKSSVVNLGVAHWNE